MPTFDTFRINYPLLENIIEIKRYYSEDKNKKDKELKIKTVYPNKK